MRLLSVNAKSVSPEQSKRIVLTAIATAILCSVSLFGAGCGTDDSSAKSAGASTGSAAAGEVQKPSAADEAKARQAGEAVGPGIQAANDAAQEAARQEAAQQRK